MLKSLWVGREERVSRAEFGQTYDMGSQAAVGHFLNGKAAISLKAARLQKDWGARSRASAPG